MLLASRKSSYLFFIKNIVLLGALETLSSGMVPLDLGTRPISLEIFTRWFTVHYFEKISTMLTSSLYPYITVS